MPPLTEIKIKSIKPTEKTQRFFDGGGLYLEVTKAGSKYWRWKYRINGKEKRLAFGVWPEVSLREARDKRDECRAKLRAGEDPGEKKEKGAKFEAIAEAWRKNMGNVWSESHATTVKGRLKLDVYPYIGERPIANISPPGHADRTPPDRKPESIRDSKPGHGHLLADIPLRCGHRSSNIRPMQGPTGCTCPLQKRTVRSHHGPGGSRKTHGGH